MHDPVVHIIPLGEMCKEELTGLHLNRWARDVINMKRGQLVYELHAFIQRGGKRGISCPSSRVCVCRYACPFFACVFFCFVFCLGAWVCMLCAYPLKKLKNFWKIFQVHHVPHVQNIECDTQSEKYVLIFWKVFNRQRRFFDELGFRIFVVILSFIRDEKCFL